MKLSSVACNNCGAPLQVPEDVQFVTCRHCQSSLAIKHTESATYTEKLEQIDARTERMEDQIESLTLEAELARLERDWSRKRKSTWLRAGTESAASRMKPPR